jgi:hypothetical protein
VKATANRKPATRAHPRGLHTRYTITHLSRPTFTRTALAASLIVVTAAAHPNAQAVHNGSSDAFARHRWHAEFSVTAALEAWNYNGSHEEIYGLIQGVTYGLRDGLLLTARQRLSYVSQRRNDSRILGLTAGLRARVYRRGRASAFLQFDLGISDAAIAAPPRGTRFNYLAAGGGGVLIPLNPRLHLVTTLELLHISNASVKGPDRNPDIEAVGPTLGLMVSF